MEESQDDGDCDSEHRCRSKRRASVVDRHGRRRGRSRRSRAGDERSGRLHDWHGGDVNCRSGLRDPDGGGVDGHGSIGGDGDVGRSCGLGTRVAIVVVVFASTGDDIGSTGNADVHTGTGSVVVTGARATRAAVGLVDTVANHHVGAAGNTNVDTAAGGEITVPILVGGLGMMDDFRDGGSGKLGSRENGSRTEGEEQAQKAREADSGGDHFCGGFLKRRCSEWLIGMNPRVKRLSL